MFSVHIEIAVLASPVNHSVNLRTVNNMGVHITPSHYSIKNAKYMHNELTFKQEKGKNM